LLCAGSKHSTAIQKHLLVDAFSFFSTPSSKSTSNGLRYCFLPDLQSWFELDTSPSFFQRVPLFLNQALLSGTHGQLMLIAWQAEVKPQGSFTERTQSKGPLDAPER
jgi:hypothetical protein